MTVTSADIDTNIPNPPRLQGNAEDRVRGLQKHQDDTAERLRVQLETIKQILADNGM